MEIETDIMRDFEKPPPRRVCLKRDSPEAGVGFNPLGVFTEIGGCGGIIMAGLLLAAIIPAIRNDALLAAAVFAVSVGLLSLLFSARAVSELRHHKRLAQHGEAVLGRVTRLAFAERDDGTPATPTYWTLEYEFRTRSGQELSDKRETPSGWYEALARGDVPPQRDCMPVVVEAWPVVVVYLPESPKVNEPYNSLKYRVFDRPGAPPDTK